MSKNFTGISIDTNIFINHEFYLESSPFNGLKQFDSSPVSLLITDIIHRECLTHLSERIGKSSDKAEGSLKTLKANKVIGEKYINAVLEAISERETSRDIAENRLSELYDSAAGEFIEVSEYADIGQLFELYFDKKPPFGEGQKKQEFPDAGALLTLQGWAEQNDTHVVFVSKDKDSENLKEEFDRITVLDNLNKALELFQPSDDVEFIKDFLQKQKPFENLDIVNEISSDLSNYVENLYLTADGECAYYFEQDDTYIVFESFEFTEDINNNIDISVIRVDSTSVQVSIPVYVECEVFATFSCYVRDSIDKDYVFIGGEEKTAGVNLSGRVIFDLDMHVSEGFKELNDISVSEVVLDQYPYVTVDFGEIDPFSGESDSDFF